MLIIRRLNCIDAASGIVTLCKWLSGANARDSCLYYLYFIIFFLRLAKQSQFIPLQNIVYFITLPFLGGKIFTFYINYVLLFTCPFPGPEG